MRCLVKTSGLEDVPRAQLSDCCFTVDDGDSCSAAAVSCTRLCDSWQSSTFCAREAHTYQIVNGGSHRLYQPTSTTNFLYLPSHYTRY
ncbi:uncharacterized protein MYCFIDRAFT_176287 [Pseudocercospora fijiensis CIRAD86]|uniref:Uncharacterized protein n=1 Tax=Pseudocercospora fijiensis (strain CIRAD86) TaxID=383855 RepID=M3ATW8_PSEFD|nr:uncharacterized protein MYCFIDRAFT_176287 [Pseudocercospora fijiensis CIRAD86]EME80932.1 hypothetical protein MYCFIDRAFT_176287 [Pseudocercospora fijiensis CIRAD86]